MQLTNWHAVASSELFVTTAIASLAIYLGIGTSDNKIWSTNKLLVMKEPTNLLPGD